MPDDFGSLSRQGNYRRSSRTIKIRLAKKLSFKNSALNLKGGVKINTRKKRNEDDTKIPTKGISISRKIFVFGDLSTMLFLNMKLSREHSLHSLNKS